MSVEIVSGKFLAANAVATHVECGFVPDFILAISDPGTTPVQHQFYKLLYDIAATGRWGFIYAAGVAPTPNANALEGIIPYDTSIDTVFLPATNNQGYIKAPSVADWLTTTTPVARVANGVLGSCIRPTTHNGLVYECTISGGVMGVEPVTWPLVPGATVSDTNNTYIARVERVVKRGVKGFTVGATISVDGIMWVFRAEKHDRYTYMGDADIENPVTFADHHNI